MRSLVAALALCLSMPGAGFACSCVFALGNSQPCVAFQEADAVFVGKVTGSSVVTKGKPRWAHRVVHFAVLEGFAGVKGKTIDIGTGLGDGDCGYEFATGKSYFVYAWRIKEGTLLWTTICGATKSLAVAQTDLTFARQVVHGGDRTRLYGRVVRSSRADLGEPLRQDGIGSVTVTAEGPAHQQLTVVTDGEGLFSIAGSLEGDYTVRAAAPGGFPGIAPQRVTIPAGQCNGVVLESSGLATLAGRAVDLQDRPIPSLWIELVSMRDRELLDGEGVYTSADGRYLFEHIPPGSYVLAVNPKGKTEALKAPYPKTFFPRAGSPTEAEPIILRAQEVRDLPDFEIAPPAAARTVTGIVRWPAGRPAAGIHVVLRAGLCGLADETDVAGRFKLTGYEGYTYTLTAMTLAKGPSAQAKPEKVVVGGEDLELDLVLDQPRSPDDPPGVG